MSDIAATDNIIGDILVAIATGTSLAGVVHNNLYLNHVLAMQIWAFSNIVFAAFFYGQYKQWWNGGLPSAILCGFYIFCFITGIYGLMQ
jgi:hypothetical protein